MTRSLLLISLALTVACGDRGAPPPELAPCQAPGVPRCVLAGDLILSAQPTPDGLRYLAGRGFTTVVSTRGLAELNWDERAVVESLGMRFVQIPMENPVWEITDAQVARLDSVLTHREGPILLHCHSANRTAALWGAWLAEKQGVAPAAALDLATLAGMTGVRPTLERRLMHRGR